MYAVDESDAGECVGVLTGYTEVSSIDVRYIWNTIHSRQSHVPVSLSVQMFYVGWLRACSVSKQFFSRYQCDQRISVFLTRCTI